MRKEYFMKKKYLSYLPFHVTMVLVLLIPIYMGAGAPGTFKPVQVWFQIVVVFFPIANIGNFVTLFRAREEESNLKYFLLHSVASPFCRAESAER